MSHLAAEDFIDIADGSRPEGAAPHLASCATCRQQLADLRATIGAVAEAPVPEPSPLFWDHLSARISAAVAEDSAARPRILSPTWRSWRVALAGAAAAVLVAAAMTMRIGLSPSSSGAPDTVHSAGVDADPVDLPLAEGPMVLVAELAAELDWDAAAEAGLGAGAGAMDRLVPELSDAERMELRRLLHEELVRSGA